MSALSEDQKRQIIEALTKAGVTRECPRCGNAQFASADALFARPLQPNLPNISLSGRFIPTCIVFCKRCGFVSEHAIMVLGLNVADFQIKSEAE